MVTRALFRTKTKTKTKKCLHGEGFFPIFRYVFLTMKTAHRGGFLREKSIGKPFRLFCIRMDQRGGCPYEYSASLFSLSKWDLKKTDNNPNLLQRFGTPYGKYGSEISDLWRTFSGQLNECPSHGIVSSEDKIYNL